MFSGFMVCDLLISSLLLVHPSHAYVIIGMMMVSEIMLAVAPFTFLSISVMRSDSLPLLLMVSPR